MSVSPRLNILGLRIQSKIGEGKSGTVFLTTDNKYVIKILYFDDDTAFNKEVNIGRLVKSEYGAKVRGKSFKFMIGTQRYEELRKLLISTKSISSNRNPIYIGYYVMDNLELRKGEKAVPLSEFIKNECPTENHPIYKKLRKTLESFYKLGFYHGDLHFNNIYVILSEGKIKHVKLIDYGSAMEFEGNGKKNKCLEEYLENISKDFERKDEKYVSPATAFLGYGRYQKDGTIVRSDVKMLETNPIFLERLVKRIRKLEENVDKINSLKKKSRFQVVNNDDDWF